MAIKSTLSLFLKLNICSANGGTILRLTLPKDKADLFFKNPLEVPLNERPGALVNEANLTLVSNLTSQPYGLTLDLREGHRAVFWTQPGTPGAFNGRSP